VFSRLRLVISWRFRLIGSMKRISRTRLAQWTRTTGNDDDIALQFATRTPRISSSGKTRQKFPFFLSEDDDEISINSRPSLDTMFSSAELYKRTPETSSLTTLTTCLDVKCSVFRHRTLRRSTMSEAEDAVRNASFMVEASFPCASLYRRFRAQEQLPALARVNDTRVVTSGNCWHVYTYVHTRNSLITIVTSNIWLSTFSIII